MKWSRHKMNDLADGWGRNYWYESGDWAIVPGEPRGWFVSCAGERRFGAFPTLGAAKRAIAVLMGKEEVAS